MLIDTNIALRWLLNDHALLSRQAEALVKEASAHSLIVPSLVTAEIVYVLRSKTYDRQQTSFALQSMMEHGVFLFEDAQVMRSALNTFVTTKLDFADCYLLARALTNNLPLKTFDKKLQKLYEAGR